MYLVTRFFKVADENELPEGVIGLCPVFDDLEAAQKASGGEVPVLSLLNQQEMEEARRKQQLERDAQIEGFDNGRN